MNKLLVPSLIIISALFSACEQFDYNVYQTNRYDGPVEATTSYNLELLRALPQKDTLYLVFTGDTQRYYDDLDNMIDVINAFPKVDAVFVAGDLVEFAMTHEFEWVCEELTKLNAPFLTVIGNHDCLANGVETYTDLYGPVNYAFTWNGIRFIMHNTNGREFNFNGTVPDIQWMKEQLADTANYEGTIFLSHVPSNHEDFDAALESPYSTLIRESKKTILSVNGHRHRFGLNQTYGDKIWYLNTSSPHNRYVAYVKVYPYSQDAHTFDCELVHY